MLFVFMLDKWIKCNATRRRWCCTWCDAKPIPIKVLLIDLIGQFTQYQSFDCFWLVEWFRHHLIKPMKNRSKTKINPVAWLLSTVIWKPAYDTEIIHGAWHEFPRLVAVILVAQWKRPKRKQAKTKRSIRIRN